MTMWYAQGNWLEVTGGGVVDAMAHGWFGIVRYDLDRMGLPSVWFEVER